MQPKAVQSEPKIEPIKNERQQKPAYDQEEEKVEKVAFNE
jgi:hypothetical protein